MVFPAMAALLLVGAGLAKVLRPTPAVTAMQAIGLPSSTFIVRIGAALEVLLGCWSIVIGSVWALMLVVLSYLAFALFLAVARRSPNVASCGCFGESGSPPSIRQIVVDFLVAAGCGVALLVESPPLRTLLHRSFFLGMVFSVITLLGAWFSVLVLDPPLGTE